MNIHLTRRFAPYSPQLAECEFPDNTELQIRRLNTPPETICLHWRDYYDEYLQEYPLQSRVKSAAEQRFGLNETYIESLVETYSVKVSISESRSDHQLYLSFLMSASHRLSTIAT